MRICLKDFLELYNRRFIDATKRMLKKVKIYSLEEFAEADLGARFWEIRTTPKKFKHLVHMQAEARGALRRKRSIIADQRSRRKQ